MKYSPLLILPLLLILTHTHGQDLERTFSAQTSSLLLPTPTSKGFNPSLVHSPSTSSLLIASTSDPTLPTPSLHLTRCSLPSLACTTVDVTSSTPSAPSLTHPALVVHGESAYIVGSGESDPHTPLLFTCPLPALSPCTFLNMDTASGGTASVTNLHATIQVVPSTLEATLVAVGNFANSGDRPVFYRCALDGASCSIRAYDTSAVTFRVGFHAVILPLNVSGTNLLQVHGADYGSGSVLKSMRYIDFNPNSLAFISGATQYNGGGYTDARWTGVDAVFGEGNAYARLAMTYGAGMNSVLYTSKCTGSSCGGFIPLGLRAGITYPDSGLSPSLAEDLAGRNIFVTAHNKGAGDRIFVYVSTVDGNVAAAIDLSEQAGRTNGSALAVDSVFDPESRYLYAVAQDANAGNSSVLYSFGRIPIIIPFFGGCVKGCIMGVNGGNVSIAVQDFVPSDNTFLINGKAPSELNITVSSLEPLDLETSPFAGRSRILLQTASVSTLRFTFPPGQEYGIPVITATHTSTGTVLTLDGVVVDPAFDAGCASPGQWFSQGACRACPVGGSCPGGSRVWPIDGYWSFSETEAPIKCLHDDCCGAVGTRNECPIQTRSDGTRETQRCSPSSGRSGVLCSECVTPAFYKDAGTCRPCDSDNSGQFAGLVLAFLVMAGILALSVALLPEPLLAKAGALLVAFQQFVAVGRIGSARLTGEGSGALADFFRVLSVVLFDVESVKPQCFVDSSIGFVDVFTGMWVLLIIAVVVFVVAAGVYAGVGHRVLSSLRDKESGVVEVFPRVVDTWFRRCTVAFTLLCVLAYYQISLRVAQAVSCVEDDTSGDDPESRLRVELATICYSSSHAGTGIVGWLAMAAFVIAFPLVLLTVMVLGWSSPMSKESVFSSGPVRFMTRGLRPKYFAFRITSLALSLVLAVNAAAADNDAVLLGVFGLSFAINVLVVGVLMPFKSLISNLIQIAVGIGAGIQMVVFLAITDSSTDSRDNADAWLYTLVAFLTLSSLIAAGFVLWRLLNASNDGDDGDADWDGTDSDAYTLITATESGSTGSSGNGSDGSSIDSY